MSVRIGLRGLTALAGLAWLVLFTHGAAAQPADGTYTGTTQQAKSISVTVAGGKITSWTLDFVCGAASVHVTTNTSCTINGNSFTCGSSSCIPFVANTRLAGTFAGGGSVSGTLTVANQPDQFSACCNLSNLTWSATGGNPQPSCTPDDTTLCVDDQTGDRRFKVRVHYSTQGGGLAGDAHAIPLASLGVAHGGLFWFFGADNPELLVKVLNACGLNQTFWIFLTAGTNVGFTATVTDMITGQNKIYTNQDNHAALPVQDTSALPCNP